MDAFSYIPPSDSIGADENIKLAMSGLLSPADAQSLVAAPPSAPAQSSAGQTTPQTGSLATAPSQAQPRVSGPAMLPGVATKPENLASQFAGQQQAYSAKYPAATAPAMPNGLSSIPGYNPRPSLPAVAQPSVVPDKPNMQTAQDQSKLDYLKNSGSGVSQIKNPFLRGLARVGDVLGTALTPGWAAAIPGTTLHHQELLGQQAGIVGDDAEQQQQRAQLQDTQSQSAERDSQAQRAAAQAAGTAPVMVTPEMHAANPSLVVGTQIRPADYGKTLGQQTRNTGLEATQQTKNTGLEATRQSVIELHQSEQKLNDAKAELARAGDDPKSAAYQLALRKLQAASSGHDAAMIRAQAQLMNAYAGNKGTDPNGNPLAGAGITDNGNTVGYHFQHNIIPTGTERNKADMAASAGDQLNDIKSIMQKHATLFGPGYGQTSAFRQWIGSQDPDAQKFLAARTIAADHLAGTFGGRSEPALAALDKAIGQFKDNPKAAVAGIDQLLKANSRFIKAGTPRTVGSNAAQPGGQNPPNQPPARPSGPKLAPLKPGNIYVQVPGHPIGQIPASAKNGFLVKNRGARVVQNGQ